MPNVFSGGGNSNDIGIHEHYHGQLEIILNYYLITKQKSQSKFELNNVCKLIPMNLKIGFHNGLV